MSAAADALDEDALARNERLRFLSRLADDNPVLADLERAQFVSVPGRAGAAGLFRSAMLRLVALALRLEIDAQEGRAEERQNDRRADRAEDVGHGIGDRHGVEQSLGLLGRQSETVDRVGGETHGRRDRLRTGVQARRRTDIVAGDQGSDVGGKQAEHADDRGEQRLRNAVLRDAAHELRTHPVTDGEQEHEEERRLERRRNRNSELPDDHRGDERRGHRAKAEAFVGEGAEVIPESEGQEDRDLGIASQGVYEPIDHDTLAQG